jgi:hypothetical protein
MDEAHGLSPVMPATNLSFVMPGFMPGIHVLTTSTHAVPRAYFEWTIDEHRCLTDAGLTVANLHRLRAEFHFFVFAQVVVVHAQVFIRSAA